jgi:hypothetical protein
MRNTVASRRRLRVTDRKGVRRECWETATDILWIFNDPAHYAALVLQRGWTEHAFRRWLANSMRAALLPD